MLRLGIFPGLIFSLLLTCSVTGHAQLNASQWADSVLRRMSAEEKVRQMFILPIAPDQVNPNSGLIDKVQSVRPGGLLLTGGGPVSTARMLNRLQKSTPVPYLVALQAEWGIGQTLDSISDLPVPILLGATSDSLAWVTGRLTARQMKSIGAHVNLGPNADSDVPGASSSVGYRYFSDDPELVTQRTSAYVKGLQQDGLMAVVRHIPGKEEPLEKIYTATAQTLAGDSLSFLPFGQLLKNGAGGINTAYLHYVLWQRNKATSVSQSSEFVSELLRKKLNYQGLVLTEIPFLQNFSSKRKGEVEKLAFQTGHDLLIAPLNADAAVRKILRLVRKNSIYAKQLDASVRRILEAKFRSGAYLKTAVDGHLNRETGILTNLLNQSVGTASITVLKNDQNLLPIRNLDSRQFHLIDMGGYSDELNQSLNRFISFRTTKITSIQDTVRFKSVSPQDVTLLAITDQSFTIQGLSEWLKKLSKKCNLVVLHSGNPAVVSSYANLPTVVEGYYPSQTERFLPQLLFGALPASGKIPFRINGFLSDGLATEFIERLSTGIPESVEMSSFELEEIDAIAEEAINSGATPGCRVVIARKGKIIVNRSYGWHSYEKKSPVTEESIYDLASVTKVAATLQATMHLYDKGLIDLQKKASHYLPELRTSNKKDFSLKDILTHQSGLWPYLPFWTRTMKDGQLLPEFYASTKSPDYPYDVSEGVYASRGIRDSLWNWIIDARVIEKKDRTPFDYRYSDMGFYILQHLAETITGEPLEKFLDEFLYRPLGAQTLGFLPLNKFSSRRIAPTEDDRGFRKSLLTGYVHDQGAAMHGGVAGHAGLFSNATDLAKLGQLWLRKGYYGGQSYFKPETFDLFTSRQFTNSRRGLGWDKPWPEDSATSPTGSLASPKTFGHTGFTGTCIWVDPDYDLVYVFLSNRVHPDMTNSKLLNANIRTRIHDVAYKSIHAFQAIKP
ncbi:MAG: serine hydrolase [Cyclobacteriaceae bacterium]